MATCKSEYYSIFMYLKRMFLPCVIFWKTRKTCYGDRNLRTSGDWSMNKDSSKNNPKLAIAIRGHHDLVANNNGATFSLNGKTSKQ